MGRKIITTILFIFFMAGIGSCLKANDLLVFNADGIAQTENKIESKNTQSSGKQESEVFVKVYTQDSYVVIETSQSAIIDIYSATGLLRTQQSIDKGSTYIQLSKGVYIVNVNGKAYKVMISL